MNRIRGFLLVSVISLSAAQGVASAQSGGSTTSPAMVEWLIPAVPSAIPQTDEQAEAGKKFGRPAPEREILQPSLDSALPAYEPRKDIKLSGNFKGAASDVLAALTKMWITKFAQYYPEVKIDVGPPYAGSLGAVELVKGNLDFVFVSRELKPDDITGFKAKFGYDPLSVPITGGTYRHYGFLDAMGFFVSKENPLEKISFDQLDAIYSSTRHRGLAPLTTWGQLGLTGDWADKPIHAYGIQPWNGFEEFIRQRVLSIPGKRGEWGNGIRFDKLVFPMAKRVAEDKYGIAYSGLAFIDSPVKMLPLAVSQNGPYYAPTYENVALAVYPLSRLTFFNTNKAPGKPLNPVLEELVRFVLSREGQQTVLEQGLYLPLRAGQLQSSRDLLSH